MGRIHDENGFYVYEIDDTEIPLDENTYQAHQHRSTAHALMDWVGVLDPRDDEYYSHFRYDQPEEPFEEMMELAKMIGAYVLTDTPYEYIRDMFDRQHTFTETDWMELGDEPN